MTTDAFRKTASKNLFLCKSNIDIAMTIGMINCAFPKNVIAVHIVFGMTSVKERKIGASALSKSIIVPVCTSADNVKNKIKQTHTIASMP